MQMSTIKILQAKHELQHPADLNIIQETRIIIYLTSSNLILYVNYCRMDKTVKLEI